MIQQNSKNKILKRIASTRKSRGNAQFIENTTEQKKFVYKEIFPDPIICFCNELKAVNGICYECDTMIEAIEKIQIVLNEKKIATIYCRENVIKNLLHSTSIVIHSNPESFINMSAGVTTCEFLVARTGSIVISSNTESGRQMNIFPPLHIVLASTKQIVNNLEDAYEALQSKYGVHLPSLISTITGPSRTADIEKTLVLGAHGPKELIVLLYNE